MIERHVMWRPLVVYTMFQYFFFVLVFFGPSALFSVDTECVKCCLTLMATAQN